MTPGRILFFGLLIVAGVLFVLNPGEDKFKEFLRDEIAERAAEAGREAGGQVGGSLGADVGGFLADRLGRRGADVADDLFEREDLKLFSIYTADLNGRQPGGAWKFLGIAGWFLPLENPTVEDFTR